MINLLKKTGGEVTTGSLLLLTTVLSATLIGYGYVLAITLLIILFFGGILTILAWIILKSGRYKKSADEKT